MTVYIGIDWSESKHNVLFMNPAGAEIARLLIEHTPQGLLQFEATCHRLGLPPADCWIGLETAHHLLIDFLWSRGFTQLYVIPPSQVKANRGRYTASGARDDWRDGFLLADMLRTDRQRQHPWQPDSLLTQQLRAQVSWLQHLTRSVQRLANRLRSLLLRYYPAGLAVFGDLTSQIALHFLQTYPNPEAAQRLSDADFQAFAHQQRYTHPQNVAACYARLSAERPQPLPDTIQVYQDQALQLAGLLLAQVGAKRSAEQRLRQLFAQHPEAAIFASLPGTGDFLAPALAAKFGEDRQRFPTPASLQALAGTCPVTDQSGQRRTVLFRRACDREFRTICQQWALASLRASPWAQAYWARIRPHCRSDSHALRCLANRWLAVAWKLWQSHEPYDEAYHLQQHLKRSQPLPAR